MQKLGQLWSWMRSVLSILFVLALILIMGPSVEPQGDSATEVRVFTRAVEFDYASWIVETFGLKIRQAALGTAVQLPEAAQHDEVLDYLDLIGEIQAVEGRLAEIYTDPEVDDPALASADQQALLEDLYAQRASLGPLAEAILQNMVTQLASEEGFTPGGQPLPPVLYHSTPLPWALIISPRAMIQQDANISLEVGLTVADHAALEQRIEESLPDLSALVVPIGGIGAYPTMVTQTTDLNWLVEVIAHEWMHNYLTLRPLGMLYGVSGELRTMNETAANIFGKEISALVIARYFPERVPAPPPPPEPRIEEETGPLPAEAPLFNFREEMHETRVTVDALLENGEIERAEAYLEARRGYLWDNGYRIRKLNQAYFAFYGAYADVPGGAAGSDPVGEAVRTLRAQSPSLHAFIRQIAWLTDFVGLQSLLSP
jgi:hypothetical protein